MEIHKDPARQAIGWENRRNGLRLEAIIANACDYYLENYIAKVEKTPEPMRPIKSLGAGKFTAIFTEKAQCDYKGTLGGGQAIAFEAKSTKADRIKQDVITPAQWKCLDEHYRLGAQCCVIVSLLNGAGFYRVPWAVWKTMKELFGHKYMTAENLKPFEIQLEMKKGKVCLMFLEGE